MKVEQMGFIEIPADVVLHAAIALKAEIICQRQERVDALVDSVMARKKPSWLALFFESNKANIQSADNREDALKIAKKISMHMFDCPYYEAREHRQYTYGQCMTLISSANTVMQKNGRSQPMMMLDLHTADLLAKYFD